MRFYSECMQVAAEKTVQGGNLPCIATERQANRAAQLEYEEAKECKQSDGAGFSHHGNTVKSLSHKLHKRWQDSTCGGAGKHSPSIVKISQSNHKERKIPRRRRRGGGEEAGKAETDQGKGDFRAPFSPRRTCRSLLASSYSSRAPLFLLLCPTASPSPPAAALRRGVEKRHHNASPPNPPFLTRACPTSHGVSELGHTPFFPPLFTPLTPH